MPSKIALINWLNKHGDDAIDVILERMSSPAARQKDLAAVFNEPESTISKFLSSNFIFPAVLHPDLREFYDELMQRKRERYHALSQREAKIIRIVEQHRGPR